MTSKEITYKTLKSAVEIAFKDDTEILNLYDPTREVQTIEDITEDIYRKIREYDAFGLHLYGVYDKSELIGYFVHKGGMLISFSISVKYRTRHNLRSFFSLIREKLPHHFFTFLWTKNIRAITWLVKNKMEIINSNNHITQLVCP